MKKEKTNRVDYLAEYQKRYTKENYDLFQIKLKKGKKELIKQRAESLGLSMNAYIVGLIEKDMGEGNDD